MYMAKVRFHFIGFDITRKNVFGRTINSTKFDPMQMLFCHEMWENQWTCCFPTDLLEIFVNSLDVYNWLIISWFSWKHFKIHKKAEKSRLSIWCKLKNEQLTNALTFNAFGMLIQLCLIKMYTVWIYFYSGRSMQLFDSLVRFKLF